MKTYFCINTGNEKIENLHMLFSTKEKAITWCKKCTSWKDEEIEKNIFVINVYIDRYVI